MKAIEIGKNRNNVKQIEFTNKEGNVTIYRLQYKGTAKTLEIINDIIKASYERELTETEYTILVKTIWIVFHHDTENANSKLAGIKSISTCCLDNKFCLARMKDPESICSHCYASTQQSRNYGLTDHNTINGLILRNVIIPIDIFKTLDLFFDKFARIESFGDVENVTQAINYIHIMKAFPETSFGVWTKNETIWEKAFETEGKPENCSFIVSSNKVNDTVNIKPELKKFVDHVFTVYDKETVNENNVNINCGGRKCMECLKAGKNCYFRNTAFNIKELLK